MASIIISTSFEIFYFNKSNRVKTSKVLFLVFSNLIQKGFKITANWNSLKKTDVFVHQSAENKNNNFMLLVRVTFVQYVKIQKYFHKNL